MLYAIPNYYHDFRCQADKCEDTCCAGWQIVIDEKSLDKYKRVKGAFRPKLLKSINWISGSFRQSGEKRCAMLNGDNLCDMQLSLGESALCRTCRRYPRHVEEFENVREITLSLSCPEAARILLSRTEPVTFLTYEKEGEEEYDDFDPFLYSRLADAREIMRSILQNREVTLEARTGLILGLAHDMQIRIKKRELFSCEGLFVTCQKESSRRLVERKLAEGGRNRTEKYAYAKKMFGNLYHLERLAREWDYHLRETDYLLFGNGSWGWEKLHGQFKEWMKRHMLLWEIQYEQLLIYFLDTYFCGAVYDGRAYTKVQMAVVSVWLIYEMMAARWLKNGRMLDIDDIILIVYRFSRELEHSDKNLDLMEKMMGEAIIPLVKR